MNKEIIISTKKIVVAKKVTAPKKISSPSKSEVADVEETKVNAEGVKPRRIQTAEGWKRSQLKKKK